MSEEIPNVDLDSPQKEDLAELNDDQKLSILNLWNSRPENPPTLLELCEAAWGEKIDPRSRKGMAVRSFISSRKLKPAPLKDYKKKEKIQFTEEQKAEILKLAPTMRPFEIARKVFNNPTLEPARIEVKSVIAYLDEIPTNIKSANGIVNEEDSKDDYEPPRTIPKLIIKVNEYANPDKALNYGALSPKDRKGLTACLGYLNNKRLIYQLSSHKSMRERILLESTFIKYTFDKPDLTQEEVDQYIILATEAVIAYNARKTISMLQKEQNDLVDNGERMSMTLIDAITGAQKTYDDSISRQGKLFAALTQKRSERLSKQIKENASILNLVTLWKDEESRKEMIRYQMLKKKALSDEIKNYMTWGEQKMKILGISENEILEG